MTKSDAASISTDTLLANQKPLIAQATGVSRRVLLKTGVGFALGIYLARGGSAFAQAPAAPDVNIAPNTFLVITRVLRIRRYGRRFIPAPI